MGSGPGDARAGPALAPPVNEQPDAVTALGWGELAARWHGSPLHIELRPGFRADRSVSVGVFGVEVPVLLIEALGVGDPWARRVLQRWRAT